MSVDPDSFLTGLMEARRTVNALKEKARWSNSAYATEHINSLNKVLNGIDAVARAFKSDLVRSDVSFSASAFDDR